MADTLELVLIRYGESIANRDNSTQVDPELTELGVQQAERLALWLKANFQFAALYSSPMIRSRRTAELAAKDLGVPVVYRDDLREVDFNLGEALPQFSGPVCALTEPGVLRPSMSRVIPSLADGSHEHLQRSWLHTPPVKLGSLPTVES